MEYGINPRHYICDANTSDWGSIAVTVILRETMQ